MPLYYNGTKVKNIYFNGNKLKKVYHNDILVYKPDLITGDIIVGNVVKFSGKDWVVAKIYDNRLFMFMKNVWMNVAWSSSAKTDDFVDSGLPDFLKTFETKQMDKDSLDICIEWTVATTAYSDVKEPGYTGKVNIPTIYEHGTWDINDLPSNVKSYFSATDSSGTSRGWWTAQKTNSCQTIVDENGQYRELSDPRGWSYYIRPFIIIDMTLL